MRVTKHNGRGPKNSNFGYNPKHNDRDFEHELTDNFYWNLYHKGYYTDKDKNNKENGILTFEQAEEKYYENMFYKQYEMQQQKYKKKGNYDRLKTFEEWRNSKRYVPEESITQIGNSEKNVDANLFENAYLDFLVYQTNWSKQHNNCFRVLDMSVHYDETVIHAHDRKVWQYRDSNGVWCIGQDKALEQAGIGLPDPSKPRSRFNNRKMVYDKMMREKWIEICKGYGLEIEEEALPDGKHNMDKEEMIKQKYQRLSDEIKDMETLKDGIEQKYKQEYEEKKTFLDNLYKTRNKAVDERESKLDDREFELNERASKLNEDKQNFDKLVEAKAIQKAREMFSRVNNKSEEAQTQTRTNNRRTGYTPWE